MTDLVGRQLGSYRLLSKLGAGTFGEVYLGEHVYLNILAAIKVLRDRLADDEMAGFLSEARNIARLRHPNIVRILDFAEDRNVPFLVMDYAANGTLYRRHPRGTGVSLDMIVLYVKQIASALQYAHGQKLIHRDVKPANMLLGQQGEILLSDFGIATISHSSRSMETQDIAGTVTYMAPEQIQGKPRSASDQYALGVIVYQWLTGASPFLGSEIEIITQHLTAPPPPLRTKVSTITADVEQVVLTALAKDPKNRFVSIMAFADALEQACKIPSPLPTYSHEPPLSFHSEPQPRDASNETKPQSPQDGRVIVIGIDLGTTNSCVAVMEAGEPVIIPNAEGAQITPSVIAITKNGEHLVGEAARRQAITNPENTIYSIKRFMGRKYDEVSYDRRSVPYKVVAASNGDAMVEIQGKQFSPAEVSAMILQKLRTDAEAYMGMPITQVVITVPSYFNDIQRQATKDACRIAGLEVLRIINEPTSASLAYGLDRKKNERIAVYDLGGGTFNISILELDDGVFEVKSTNGDTRLGGDDFDLRIIYWIADEFRKEHGIDLRQNRMALQRLKEAAELAKKELSSSTQSEINLPFITADANGPRHLTVTLTRSKLEQLVEDLIERTLGPVMKALADAGLRPGDINEVVLVGGQTRMPAVQAMVRRIFDCEFKRSTNLSEVVAIGSAIQAGVMTGAVRDVLLLDVIPFSLGIETIGGVFTRLIERNTTIPTQKSLVFSTSDGDQLEALVPILPPGNDNQTSIEVKVLRCEHQLARDNRSLGTFILDGISLAPPGVSQIEVTFDINAKGFLNVLARDTISGREQKIIIDATSCISKDKRNRKVLDALGIEIQDGLWTSLIERDTIIPVKKSRLFPTKDKVLATLLPTILPPLSKNQTSVIIKVLQGEHEFAKDNHSPGSFIFDGIPSAPRGVPQIEVTFEVDADASINITAYDKSTGREKKIAILASSGLSEDQIKRMTHEAESYAIKAKRRMEEAEERNLADNAAYRAEKGIAEMGGKITSEQKSKLELKIANLRSALLTVDIAHIKSLRASLEEAFYKINEEIYH